MPLPPSVKIKLENNCEFSNFDLILSKNILKLEIIYAISE